MDPTAVPLVVVGRVRKPHGLKGELAIFPLTDDPVTVFEVGRDLTLLDLRGEVQGKLRVAQARHYHRELLLRLEAHPDRESLEAYRGLFLAVDRELLPPLQEGEVYFQELPGYQVEDQSGAALGLVTRVYELPQGAMLEIQGAEREFMLPFHREYVRKTDTEARRLVVAIPPGLLD